MKTSKEFKKLLQFLEEQNKKERKGYNQGVDVPLLFKITKDPNTGELLIDGKSFNSDEVEGYVCDLSDLSDWRDYIYLKLSDIPKEKLQPTLPEQFVYESKEQEEEDNERLCKIEEIINGEDIDFGDLDVDLDEDEEDFIEDEAGTDNDCEDQGNSLIEDIKEYMESNCIEELYILLNYNLYKYKGDINVVDPGRCYDSSLDRYGMNIVKKSIESLGL